MAKAKTAKGWAGVIREACRAAGTYQPYFEEPIQALGEILAKRDAAARQYRDTGGKPVVVYTNKGGAANPVKNPMLVLWLDLQAAALSYYRELGLTPSGRSKLGLPPDAVPGDGGADPMFGD